jgi:hypothetical protein
MLDVVEEERYKLPVTAHGSARRRSGYQSPIKLSLGLSLVNCRHGEFMRRCLACVGVTSRTVLTPLTCVLSSLCLRARKMPASAGPS